MEVALHGSLSLVTARKVFGVSSYLGVRPFTSSVQTRLCLTKTSLSLVVVLKNASVSNQQRCRSGALLGCERDPLDDPLLKELGSDNYTRSFDGSSSPSILAYQISLADDMILVYSRQQAMLTSKLRAIELNDWMRL